MKMVPLTSKLIDEGEFQEELEECLKQAQIALAEHRERFGDEAHKASTELVAKVKFTIQNAAEGMVSIKWGVDVKRPKRPEGASVAIESFDDSGQPALFVKAGGSDNDPRQSKFATRDGRLVDNEAGTGEER